MKAKGVATVAALAAVLYAGAAGAATVASKKQQPQSSNVVVAPAKKTVAKAQPPRGVDQMATGSVRSAEPRETCNVRKVELFDKRGNYVKSERMRVCQ
mgnify:CR=1 FL=1